MSKTREFTETLVDYIDQMTGNPAIQGGRIVLGGSEGPDGGSGGSWQQPIGQLTQKQVTYDTTEAATDSTDSPSSLLDNLNHIRYDVEHLDGDNVAVTSDDQVTGGLTVVFPVAVPSGAAGNKDLTLANKVRVIDVWGAPAVSGHPSDTIQVKNGTNAITDEMDWSGLEDDLVRAGNINHTHAEIAAGGTLRVTTVDEDENDDVASGKLYILAMRIL